MLCKPLRERTIRLSEGLVFIGSPSLSAPPPSVQADVAHIRHTYTPLQVLEAPPTDDAHRDLRKPGQSANEPASQRGQANHLRAGLNRNKSPVKIQYQCDVFCGFELGNDFRPSAKQMMRMAAEGLAPVAPPPVFQSPGGQRNCGRPLSI